jgi:hypothetical protein
MVIIIGRCGCCRLLADSASLDEARVAQSFAQIIPYGCASDKPPPERDDRAERRVSCVRADGGVLSGTD